MKKVIFSKKNLLGISLAIAMAGSAAMVTAGSHSCGKGHSGIGHNNPLQRMVSHIDLDDTQTQKVESILEGLHDKKSRAKGMGKLKAMMTLDPEASDYMVQAEAVIDASAATMKAHMLDMAAARQEIHNLLTDEQKLELKEHMEKKMARMSKKEGRCKKDKH